MTELLNPDICVIGAGSGGLTVAATARAFGASVVLIERGDMGGDCLNAGCVPSKALIAAAGRAHAMADAARFGIAKLDPKISFRKVHDHVQTVIAGIAPQDSEIRFRALGVNVIRDQAKFIDKRTIGVGDKRVRARRFVIATGSRPVIPPIPGLDRVSYFTNETIFANTRKLTHLVIVGAGPVGLELAQAYRRLGSAVTLVDAGRPLANADPELVEIALRRVQEEGVAVRPNTEVRAVTGRSLGIGVTLECAGKTEELDASHILIAVGRTPDLDALDLQKAGIRRREGSGELYVSRGLKTTNGRVYAIGDAAGGLQFTHAANYHAGLVIRNALFGQPVRNNPALVPKVTYTDPEIAEVGVTEPMLVRENRAGHQILRTSFGENDRARATGQSYGLAKLVVDRRGRILGAGIVGVDAGELIALFSFAIANKLSAKHLMAFIAPYPTLSEIAKRLATEYYRDQVDNPWLARLRRFVRLLP